MTPYVLVEGEKTEKRILRPWLKCLYPGLSWKDNPELVSPGEGFLLTSNGYPSILKNIEAACEDLEEFLSFDVLIIVCDSEDEDWGIHRQRFFDEVGKFAPRCPCVVAIPNCCIETWLLGNQRFVPKAPATDLLLGFAKEYDVRAKDPEDLPRMAEFRNRAETHLHYLKAIFMDRGLNAYSKVHVGQTAEEHYLRSLIQRAESTGHLKSFDQFLRDLNQIFPITQHTPTPAAPPPSPA